MSDSLANKYVFTSFAHKTQLPFAEKTLFEATYITNNYLAKLPATFGTTTNLFYTTLNQRNLSGFVGEVYKHAIHALCSNFVPNPHPDGRPDMLDVRDSAALKYYEEKCFDKFSRAPLREPLAPFKFGGVEIKSSIGNTPKAGDLMIGQPRTSLITGLNYWAHHAHACNLLGIYYDYCQATGQSPQIKGLLFCNLLESDWNKVSTGRPDRKKTSNTSLNRFGVEKLRQSLIMYSCEPEYAKMFKRLGYL